MSYILDALKKSDKQRKKDEVPDLQTIQELDSPNRPKKHSFWPYLLAAVVLLNIVVLIIWLGPWRSVETTIAENLTPAPSKAPAAPKRTNPPTIRPTTKESDAKLETVAKFHPTDPAKTSQTDQSDNAFPLGPKKSGIESLSPPLQKTIPAIPPEVQSEMPQDDLALQNQVLEQIETLTEEEEKRDPDFVRQDAEHRQQLAMPETPLESTEDTASLSSPDNMEPDVAPDRSSRSQVMDLMQLPPSIRKDVPEIHISAHVYSKKPRARLVSINGRVLREGHTLPPGLKLEEITTDGVIFSYSGYRFYIGVF